MRKHGILFAALVLVLAAPLAAQAQEPTVFRVLHRGMLGILTEGVPANSLNARQRVVLDVVPGSPAEKAGVVKGDTILRINGLAATSQVMAAPFEPGDTVVLRVKRGSRERDVTVIAAERRDQGRTFVPDSVFGEVNIIMERMRGMIDSMPRFEMRRIDGDSVTTIIIGRDTVIARGARPGAFIERRSLGPDSMFLRALPDGHFREIFGDSGRISIFGSVDGNVFTFGDSTGVFRPAEMMRAGTLLGMRAVGGAELTDMNPELGEYFGTSAGVLVTTARAGTPAERAGLRAGDVIIRANGAQVNNLVELRRALDASRAGSVELRVLRRGQNVDVTLGR